MRHSRSPARARPSKSVEKQTPLTQPVATRSGLGGAQVLLGAVVAVLSLGAQIYTSSEVPATLTHKHAASADDAATAWAEVSRLQATLGALIDEAAEKERHAQVGLRYVSRTQEPEVRSHSVPPLYAQRRRLWRRRWWTQRPQGRRR